jgi:glycosyltransferase involved in cell wall biosynthesis
MRLAVLADFPEEGWPSMDLCAEMLAAHVGPASGGRVAADRLCPTYRRLFGAIPGFRSWHFGRNADRLINRRWIYPRFVRARRGGFDAFHVVDHSYAHLVHALPADRTGVFCHDLDAFRCLLEPDREPRPRWFRRAAQRTLAGMRAAALVFHGTREVGRRLEALGLVDPDRLVLAPYGVAAEFGPDPTPADRDGPLPPATTFLLHVGSTIPRKRIDVLLEVFGRVRKRREDLRLVQVGGEWDREHAARIERLGVGASLEQLRGVSRETLAGLYRRAALVLQPSEAEGFGLPVVEALACGAAVVASDLAILREVGGGAATYCPVGDVPSWVETVERLLDDPGAAPPRDVRLVQAARFSWERQAATVAESYLRLANQR